MRNKKIIALLLYLLFIVFGLSGCNTQTTTTNKIIPPQPPEPYTLMLEQLELYDLDMAEKYADLVIKDFPNSDYVYNAYLVKNMVISSKIGVENRKFNLLSKGIGKSMLNSNDLEAIKNYGEIIYSNVQNYNIDFEITTQYILDNFINLDKIELKLPPEPENFIPISDKDFFSFYWFSQVGSPIPLDTDLTNDDKNNWMKEFYKLTHASNFSYIEYFYNISDITDKTNEKTITLGKDLLNKVIELTENEDNQYNEYRLKAQEDLNKI